MKLSPICDKIWTRFMSAFLSEKLKIILSSILNTHRDCEAVSFSDRRARELRHGVPRKCCSGLTSPGFILWSLVRLEIGYQVGPVGFSPERWRQGDVRCCLPGAAIPGMPKLKEIDLRA